MTTELSTELATEARRDSMGVETRTIDYIPETERHGKARNLFTIWFGGNIMLLTIATGLLSTAVYGLPIWAAVVALLIGNLVGGVVMALHAAQGPQMGVPQMLQTRAQFGSFGSLLVVVLVVGMYVAFFASNLVLGGQALAALTPLGAVPSTVIVGLISVAGAIFGYKLLHTFGTIMTIAAGLTLALVFVWIFASGALPATTFGSGSFTLVGFMSTLSIAALWQVAYAPYVSDYTRYMPKGTGVKPAFWATYLGCVLGSLLSMVLGSILGAAFPKDDVASALGAATPGITGLALLVFGVGISVGNAMNLYCGSLAVITVGQTLFARWIPRAFVRGFIAAVLFAIALTLAFVFASNFLVNLTNLMLVLFCVLIPWTAVNLVDYYLLRHGNYDIASLFRRDGGVYGRINGNAVACYVLGILIQLPFLSTALYTGPIASALGGVDISWIVGLAVICPLYYGLMRRTARKRSLILDAPATAPVSASVVAK